MRDCDGNVSERFEFVTDLNGSDLCCVYYFWVLKRAQFFFPLRVQKIRKLISSLFFIKCHMSLCVFPTDNMRLDSSSLLHLGFYFFGCFSIISVGDEIRKVNKHEQSGELETLNLEIWMLIMGGGLVSDLNA